MRTSSLIVLSLFFAAGCETPKKAKPRTATQADPSWTPAPVTEYDPVAEMEDRRSLGGGRLVAWALTANEPERRARALQALGRIQDPSTADTLVKGLTDPDPVARGEAAFAVGLLGLSWQPLSNETKDTLAAALKAAEAEEQDPSVRLSLLEALGRVGTRAAVDRLVERLTVPGDVQARAALSLGVAAKNGAELPAKALSAMGGLLKKDLPPSTRYGAAYGLARSKAGGARSWLVLCANDDASEVRAVCAKGLGDVGIDVDAVTLKKLLDDPDYRVAAEATVALAKMANRCKGSACTALGALADLSMRVERLLRGDAAGGGQPLLALAQQPLPPAGKALLTSLRSQLLAGVASVTDPRVRYDLANIECRLAAALDRQNGTIAEVVNCGGGMIPEVQRFGAVLRSFAEGPLSDPNKVAKELGAYAMHNDSRVKVAALGALGATKSSLAVDKVRAQLLEADPIVQAAAANALGKLGDRASIPQLRALAAKAVESPDIAPALAEALVELDAKDAAPELDAWLKSTNATVRHEAAAALTKLTGKTVVAARVERTGEGVKPPPLPLDARLLVRTRKGDFEVKLYTKEATLTASNAFQLAKKGFFRGLTFHRVVPDFVAQGGDPRGDGEGGPGYSIRCEVNRKPYGRGVVGMALNGKDTGGSQFFVTHSPQPHLDGRYTAFGEVTRGQEVVDSLLEGDVIDEVRATP